MSNRSASNRNESTLSLIIAVGLLAMMGGALIGPVLEAVGTHFSVQKERVGLIFVTYGLTALLSLPFLGFLTDRIGRKKVLIPSLLLYGTAGVSCIFAPSFNSLLFARALQGIGIAGMAPITITLIGDFYGGLEKIRAMGTFSGLLAVGGVVAPLLGGGLADISWQLPFAIYFISIPLAIVVWIWLPAPQISRISLKEYLDPIKASLTNVRTLAILFSNFLAFFLLYTIVTYIPLFLFENYGISRTLAGIFLAMQGVTVALVSIKADRIVEKIPQAGAICIGFLITGLSLFFMPLSLPLGLIAVPLGVFGAGRGLIQPQINSIVTEVAPTGRLGGIVSIYNMMKYGGQMSAPLLLGFVLAYGGYNAVFEVAGIISLIAFGVALVGCGSERRRRTITEVKSR